MTYRWMLTLTEMAETLLLLGFCVGAWRVLRVLERIAIKLEKRDENQ